MLSVIFFLILSPSLQAIGLEDDYFRGAVITDPSTTRRCEELIKERSEKINFKNKILSLIDKNQKLRKMTPSQKISILEILDNSQKSLEDKLEQASLKIQSSGEEIIRNGCPGITL